VTDALGGAIAIEAGSVTLAVRVTPKASKSAIGAVLTLPGGSRVLAVRVAAPPVDGAANAALIALLAKSLAVRRSDIRIIVGEGARLKRVRIDGDGPAIAERLMTKVAAG
jgi:uncharacterized protein (TIGR00251 family)